jgi:hypothetical protein
MYVQSLFASYVCHGEWNVVAVLAVITSLLLSGAGPYLNISWLSHTAPLLLLFWEQRHSFYLTSYIQQRHCHCSKLSVLDLRWLDNKYTIVWVEFFWLHNHSDTVIPVRLCLMILPGESPSSWLLKPYGATKTTDLSIHTWRLSVSLILLSAYIQYTAESETTENKLSY